MNQPRFSRAELKVQNIARRRADEQLLRVPWTKFRQAYEEYPRWHALALWVKGIVSAQDGASPWLLGELRKFCPEFIEQEVLSRRSRLFALHLLEWVHNREFGHAKQQGWLDALVFYGVRHPHAERAWFYWERCEREWKRTRSNEFLRFDEWWRRALRTRHSGEISGSEVARAVEMYIDWRVLLLWLRPLFASDVTLPRHVKSELERRCPGILGCQNSSAHQAVDEKARIWQGLIRRGKGHCVREEKRAGRLDAILQGVRFHPHYVRFAGYGKYWAKEWLRNPARRYPSFRKWQQAADHYTERV